MRFHDNISLPFNLQWYFIDILCRYCDCCVLFCVLFFGIFCLFIRFIAWARRHALLYLYYLFNSIIRLSMNFLISLRSRVLYMGTLCAQEAKINDMNATYTCVNIKMLFLFSYWCYTYIPSIQRKIPISKHNGILPQGLHVTVQGSSFYVRLCFRCTLLAKIDTKFDDTKNNVQQQFRSIFVGTSWKWKCIINDCCMYTNSKKSMLHSEVSTIMTFGTNR